MVEFAWGPTLRVGRERNHKTLTDETLERLRRDIITGHFGAGQRIKADALKERYSVGTSPIREALFQLASDGMVRADGQRGFSVADLTEAELRDIADWRARLESEALRRSILAGDVEWEANAVAAFHRMKRIEAETQLSREEAADLWEDYHREFHFALYSACGSPWLLRFCELLIQHGERYRRAYIAYPVIPKSITQEHQQILNAAIERDADRAVMLLEKHIRHAAELSAKHVAKPLASKPAPRRTRSKS
jgi:GntR family transcriptional regulator, carbon starvation induced regulator